MLDQLLRKFWPFHKPEEPSVRDTIEELIEETEEGEESLDPEEKTLLTNILNLRDVTAADIMVPRADIKAIPVDMSYKDLTVKLSSIHNTRFPVYRGTLDDVIGYIHVKDILEYGGLNSDQFKCEKIVKDILFIAPSMRLLDLLLQMKVSRIPMAIVVDEYGGVDGLITTWDIITELLGDLSTVVDHQTPLELVRVTDHVYIADGRLPLETLVKEFSLSLQEEGSDEIETLGGFVSTIAGRVPAKNEIIRHSSGLTFEVLEADSRRVRKVRIVNGSHQNLQLEPHGQ